MQKTERISFISSVNKIFGMNNKQIRPKKFCKNRVCALYSKMWEMKEREKEVSNQLFVAAVNGNCDGFTQLFTNNFSANIIVSNLYGKGTFGGGLTVFYNDSSISSNSFGYAMYG